MIPNVRTTFRAMAIGLIVVVGGAIVAYIAAIAILGAIFTWFGS